MAKRFPETLPIFASYPQAPKAPGSDTSQAHKDQFLKESREYVKKKALFSTPSIFERAMKVALTILVMSPVSYKKEVGYALSAHSIIFHRKPTVPLLSIIFVAYSIFDPFTKGFLGQMVMLSSNISRFCSSSRKLIVITFNGEKGGWTQLWVTARATANLGISLIFLYPSTSAGLKFVASVTGLSLNLFDIGELAYKGYLREDPSCIIEMTLKCFFACMSYQRLNNLN